MNSPLNSCCTNRPFIAQVDFAVPLLTVGGAAGSIHNLTSVFQSPTSASSALCAGPGVPATSIFFIISSAPAFAEDDLSSASARPAANVPAITSADPIQHLQ